MSVSDKACSINVCALAYRNNNQTNERLWIQADALRFFLSGRVSRRVEGEQLGQTLWQKKRVVFNKARSQQSSFSRSSQKKQTSCRQKLAKKEAD